jgi:N6-adenosine-specific RNA methylase IME4
MKPVLQQMVPISKIKMSGRSRTDLGDIAGLAASIEEIGLLHPIVITADNKLIVGERRIAAFRKLGRAEIPANVAASLEDLSLLLKKAEHDENVCRKDFIPTEIFALGQSVESLERQAAKQRQGTRTDKHPGKLPESSKADTRDIVGRMGGVSGKTYEKIKAVVQSGDEKLIEQMNRTGKVGGVYKRLIVKQKAEAIRNEPTVLPDGPFRVIACDPPWCYSNRAEDITHRTASPYPPMILDQIKALPVESRAHQDCVLWLWTTNAHLPVAFEIVRAWGFEYKTTLTWAKGKMGTGDWLRGQTEHCLMCVRGNPIIELAKQTTLLTGASGKHSEKPEEFYAMVEGLCPGSKLEMYQRKKRPAWVGFGDEVKGE